MFSQISSVVMEELNYSQDTVHLDTTSFSLSGEYASEEGADEEKSRVIEIARGFSKDHRPDLHQACLSIICEHKTSEDRKN